MSEFNLIDEPWIPVRFPDGRRGELGIRDTLLRSKEVAAVEDPSPLVVAALHRFLLAVVYRALEGPTDIDQSKKLFREGIPEEKVVNYLDEWHDRFWLFDERYPFGQNPNVRDAGVEPWTKLTAEYNGTSSKVLFDHTDTRDPGDRSPAECSRWLLSTMSFSVSGGRGYYLSPEPNAVFCIPLGRSLSQTLCFNLVQYPNREVARADSALWEREPPALPLRAPKRTALGYADLYTWQSRMVLLDGSAKAGVVSMRFAAGIGCERSLTSLDPMQPYKEVKDKGRLPVKLREGRGAWRDFASLLPDPSGEGSRTVAHALTLLGRGTIRAPMSLLIIGQKNQPPNADVDFWRMERFVLPEELQGDRLMRREIEKLLDVGEDAEKALWTACRSFARDSLGRGQRDPDKKDISAFIKQMPAIPLYWSMLEPAFHDLLRGYVLEQDREDIRHRWLKSVHDCLNEVWTEQESLVMTEDIWAIRAFVKAERPMRRKLSQLRKEIASLEPREMAV